MKDAQAFLARPHSHRKLLVQFVLAVQELRELDLLFMSASLTMIRIPASDETATLFCAAGALEVEASYKQKVTAAAKLAKWARRAGVPDVELQEIYCTYWPERANKLVALHA